MSTATHKIRESASRHKQLLAVLDETAFAKQALEKHISYLEDLEKELPELGARLKVLQRRLRIEKAEHDIYQKSVVSKFVYTAVGAKSVFEKKASKEEQDYLQALAKFEEAEARQKTLLQLIAEGKRHRSELETTVARHGEAQRELSELHDFVFSGPTPEFPEEDDLERVADLATKRHREGRARFDAQRSAVKLLGEADHALTSAQQAMKNALRHSQMDILGGSDRHNIMERQSLSSAEARIASARVLVIQAQAHDAQIPDLESTAITSGKVAMDVMFDNIFTDMRFRDTIKEASAALDNIAKKLSQELSLAQAREKLVVDSVSGFQERCDEAQAALKRKRIEIFDRVNEESTSGQVVSAAINLEAPPEYRE